MLRRMAPRHLLNFVNGARIANLAHYAENFAGHTNSDSAGTDKSQFFALKEGQSARECTAFTSH